MNSEQPIISVFGSSVGEEEIDEIRSSIESQWMGIGPKVQRFERLFAERLGTPDFTLVDSGSNALYMAVRLLNLPSRSEVILPSLTWIACAHAVVLAGCVPVFCDVDVDTFNVSRDTVERHINDSTGALMVVHYAGKPVRLAELRDLNLPIIEDAAHAVDSKVGNDYCGTMGDIGIYSFDAIKNLAMPEGGGIVVRDPQTMSLTKQLRYCGIGKSGFDSSLERPTRWWEYNISDFYPKLLPNDVCASVGLVQLRKLDMLQARRKAIWSYYQSSFANISWIIRPVDPLSDEQHSYFTYAIRVLNEERDNLARYLYKNAVYTTLRYHPLHMNPIYGSSARLPVTELLNEQALSLPIHPRLTDAEVNRVVDLVRRFRG